MIKDRLQIGTDISALFIFHPDDLAHRWNDPMRWEFYAFAGGLEFAQGNMIAWQTGSDGRFTIAFTDQPLSPRELHYCRGSWTFPYVVRHGKALVDNGDRLPCDESDRLDETDFWIEVPDGKYEVTVHVLAWYEEPGATSASSPDDQLPSYIVQFAPCEDFTRIQPALAPPILTPEETEATSPWTPWALQAESVEELQGSYEVIAVEKPPLVPGESITAAVDEGSYESVQAEWKTHGSPERVVLQRGASLPGYGAVVEVRGCSRMRDTCSLTMRYLRAVKITDIDQSKHPHRANVSPLVRPREAATAEQFSQLQQAFAHYVTESSNFRECCPSFAFEVQRANSIVECETLIHFLLTLVPLSMTSRNAVCAGSDRTRAEVLLKLFRGAD